MHVQVFKKHNFVLPLMKVKYLEDLVNVKFDFLLHFSALISL